MPIPCRVDSLAVEMLVSRSTRAVNKVRYDPTV